MPAKITCGGVDVTEHVAAMYDAIVGSLDWGSGFLSVEEIEGILIVGHVAGFEVPAERSIDSALGGVMPFEDVPQHMRTAAQRAGRDSAEWKAFVAELDRLRTQRAAAIEAWRRQVKAKADAMRAEVSET